jgi:hypothetical protein
MKKIACFMAVCVCAVFFAACSPYIGTIETNTPYDEYKATVYIQFNDVSVSDFMKIQESIIEKLPNGVEYRFGELKNKVMPLELTVADGKAFGIPDKTVLLKKELYYQYRTVTVYNPFNLLSAVPAVSGVGYYFGIELDYRSTETNAGKVTHENGEYQYYWITENLQDEKALKAIVFYDIFGNRATYYIEAVIIALIVGAIVYFVCKSRQKKAVNVTPPIAQ